MNRRYFGTDGVRAPYGSATMCESFAWRLGSAMARFAKARGHHTTSIEVIIGRDTRASGASLERAVAAGVASEGLKPCSLGIVPTPVVSLATRTRGAAFGVVITASHNPAKDNGIKFFGPSGVKLTDEDEILIEQLLPEQSRPLDALEPVRVIEGALTDYLAQATALLPAQSLAGWSIVLDTAHGAACVSSPAVLRRLGAELILVGHSPDGLNINADVGSEHPEQLSAAVKTHHARIGIAHDGDADRCVLCDENGSILDGDEVLTLLALHALAAQNLAAQTLVVTMQSNLGVDAAVQAAGGRVCRTNIGDRYVIERMLIVGATLGGESSGHVIFSEVSPTGDGLVAALKVIEVMLVTGKPLSELRKSLRKFPQRSLALQVREKKPLGGLKTLSDAILSVEAGLGAAGRVLVRYSGTESKLRVLVEGPTDVAVDRAMTTLVNAARADLEVS